MTKSYTLFSRAYRILLGLLTIGFLVISSIFSSNVQYEDNSGLWAILYSALTLTTITIFHTLDNGNKYKLLVQILACTLVLLSLVFLLILLFSVFKNGDSNLLVNGVIFIATVVNSAFLFYLVQDKKYTHFD